MFGPSLPRGARVLANSAKNDVHDLQQLLLGGCPFPPHCCCHGRGDEHHTSPLLFAPSQQSEPSLTSSTTRTTAAATLATIPTCPANDYRADACADYGPCWLATRTSRAPRPAAPEERPCETLQPDGTQLRCSPASAMFTQLADDPFQPDVCPLADSLALALQHRLLAASSPPPSPPSDEAKREVCAERAAPSLALAGLTIFDPVACAYACVPPACCLYGAQQWGTMQRGSDAGHRLCPPRPHVRLLQPLPTFDPPIGGQQQPQLRDELCPALAEHSSELWLADRPPAVAARPGTRDPSVAGGDAVLISSASPLTACVERAAVLPGATTQPCATTRTLWSCGLVRMGDCTSCAPATGGASIVTPVRVGNDLSYALTADAVVVVALLLSPSPNALISSAAVAIYMGGSTCLALAQPSLTAQDSLRREGAAIGVEHEGVAMARLLYTPAMRACCARWAMPLPPLSPVNNSTWYMLVSAAIPQLLLPHAQGFTSVDVAALVDANGSGSHAHAAATPLSPGALAAVDTELAHMGDCYMCCAPAAYALTATVIGPVLMTKCYACCARVACSAACTWTRRLLSRQHATLPPRPLLARGLPTNAAATPLPPGALAAADTELAPCLGNCYTCCAPAACALTAAVIGPVHMGNCYACCASVACATAAALATLPSVGNAPSRAPAASTAVTPSLRVHCTIAAATTLLHSCAPTAMQLEASQTQPVLVELTPWPATQLARSVHEPRLLLQPTCTDSSEVASDTQLTPWIEMESGILPLEPAASAGSRRSEGEFCSICFCSSFCSSESCSICFCSSFCSSAIDPNAGLERSTALLSPPCAPSPPYLPPNPFTTAASYEGTVAQEPNVVRDEGVPSELASTLAIGWPWLMLPKLLALATQSMRRMIPWQPPSPPNVLPQAVLIAAEYEGVIAQEWAQHEGVAEHTGAESEGVPHSSYSALLPQWTPPSPPPPLPCSCYPLTSQCPRDSSSSVHSDCGLSMVNDSGVSMGNDGGVSMVNDSGVSMGNDGGVPTGNDGGEPMGATLLTPPLPLPLLRPPSPLPPSPMAALYGDANTVAAVAMLLFWLLAWQYGRSSRRACPACSIRAPTRLLVLAVAFWWLLAAADATDHSESKESLRSTLDQLQSAVGLAAVMSTLALANGCTAIRELFELVDSPAATRADASCSPRPGSRRNGRSSPRGHEGTPYQRPAARKGCPSPLSKRERVASAAVSPGPGLKTTVRFWRSLARETRSAISSCELLEPHAPAQEEGVLPGPCHSTVEAVALRSGTTGAAHSLPDTVLSGLAWLGRSAPSTSMQVEEEGVSKQVEEEGVLTVTAGEATCQREAYAHGAELCPNLSSGSLSPPPRIASDGATLLGKQTIRSRAYAERRGRQMRCLASAPCLAWRMLFWGGHLLYVVRRRARERRAAAVACLQSSAYVAAARARVACRRRALSLLDRPPRPMPGYDVGYDATSEAFSFRDVCGVVRHEHPAAASPGPIPAYMTSGPEKGSVIAPVTPPSETMWVLCPERSGAWCYYNTASGESSWSPPESLTPLTLEPRTLLPAKLPTTRPPRLPETLQLGTLQLSTDWLAISRDAENVVLLMHRRTGAIRTGPWVALRTAGLGVYFANLVSRETRWLPPHRWMECWMSRRQWDSRTDDYADGGMPFARPPLDRPLDVARQPLIGVAYRACVEGGAPYMHEGGHPQYPPDEHDTPCTYPLDGFVRLTGTLRRNWSFEPGPEIMQWVPASQASTWSSRLPVDQSPGAPDVPERVGYLSGRCCPPSEMGDASHARAQSVAVESSAPPVATLPPGPGPRTPPPPPGLRPPTPEAPMLQLSPLSPVGRHSTGTALTPSTANSSLAQLTGVAGHPAAHLERAATLIARSWSHYEFRSYYLENFGIDTGEQLPLFRFLLRDEDGIPRPMMPA